MKKLVGCLIAFLSALSIWGATPQSCDIQIVDSVKSEFLSTKDTVIEQAVSKKIADRSEIETQFGLVLRNIQHIIDNKDVIINNEELSQKTADIFNGFISDYGKAISVSDSDKSIRIGSSKFLDVVKQYNEDFEKLCNEINGSKSNDLFKIAPFLCITSDDLNGDFKIDIRKISEDVKQSSDSIDKGRILMWVGYGLIIAILLLIVWLVSLIIRLNKRVDQRKLEIDELKRNLNLQIKQIKPTSYVGASQSGYIPQQQQVQSRRQSRRQSALSQRSTIDNRAFEKTVSNPLQIKPDEKAQVQKMDEKPAVIHLYATVNAGSPHTGFYKVSEENTGDKVFMLCQQNADAEVAEFTIVPDMTPDFLKYVIANRETYLPAIFCEKDINGNPTSIEVISKGKAKKVDGKWMVETRMSIRLV